MTIFDSRVSDEYLMRIVEVQRESESDHSLAAVQRSRGSDWMGRLLGLLHPGDDGHGSVVRT